MVINMEKDIKVNDDISKKYPLVCTTWEDIVNFGRLSLEEIQDDMEDHRLYKKEVGYLVKKTNEYLVIINDLDLSGGSDNYGSLIPVSVVLDIEYLESSDDKDIEEIDEKN